MKLPAAAYSAEVALRLRRPEAAGYLAKFSEATTLLRQGYGGFPLAFIPVAAYSAEAAASAAKAGSYGVFGEGE